MKRQASSFYPHFKNDERPTIDYFVGLFNQVYFKHESVLTDFLNPHEQEILKTIVGSELNIYFSDIFQNEEKKRAIISFDEIDDPNFEISIFTINYNQKFNQIHHRDIYGAMNNLGITQKSFGDIGEDENHIWYLQVKKDLAPAIKLNLTRVGKVSVDLTEISTFQNIKIIDDFQLDSMLVNSLRIDAISSAVTKRSRSQIEQAIAAQEIKLNWNEVTNSNIIVNIGDLISVRRFGRFQVIDELGETKRGKHRLKIKKWQTKKR